MQFFERKFDIDPQGWQIIVKVRDLNLTMLKFDLLGYLTSYYDQILSSKQLYTQVWKVKHNQGANDTVKVHAEKLRKRCQL